jgi:ArsR family metal-binding transcriptional regulator
LEFAREDLKSDILLHKMVERLISMRGKGTLTMNQYGQIVKEEVEALGESYGPRADKLLKHSHDLYHKSRNEPDAEKKQSMVSQSTKAHKVFMKAKEQHFKRNPEAYKAHVSNMMSGAAQDYKDQEKKRGIGHVRDHVETEGESIQEVSSELLGRYKEKAMKSATDLASSGNYKKSNDRLLGHMKATGKQIEKTTAAIKKSLTKENMDPKAADAMPCDCANSPDDVAPKDKKKKLIQMSKSARIIKSIYSKKGVKQESTKDPKMKNVISDLEQPKAAAVLTGGTTMTGEKRDTIEIDPMMKKGKPLSAKR